jgi:carboxylesterase
MILDTYVYKRTAMSNVMPGAEPFIYEGSTVGCVLLHGFTSTPQEMRPLGQCLKDCGFTVRGVLLADHGTRVEDLHPTTWRERCTPPRCSCTRDRTRP